LSRLGAIEHGPVELSALVERGHHVGGGLNEEQTCADLVLDLPNITGRKAAAEAQASRELAAKAGFRSVDRKVARTAALHFVITPHPGEIVAGQVHTELRVCATLQS